MHSEGMGEYMRALLADEHKDHPEYRVAFNAAHCVTALKYILLVHITVTLLLSIYLLPLSLFVSPLLVIAFGTAVFSLKAEDHLALIPFQIYLVGFWTLLGIFQFALLTGITVATIVSPAMVFFFRDSVFGHFGFESEPSRAATFVLALNVTLVETMITALLYWQWIVCKRSREYFLRNRDSTDYVHLNGTADPFAQSKTFEKSQKEFAVFSLDNVDLTDSEENKTTAHPS